MAESPHEVKYGRGQNPRSLANLTPWQKGQAPNVHGVQGPKITPRIKHYLDMDPAEFFRLRPKTVADIVAMGYVLEAMQSGFDRGRTEVIERADGKVTTPIEVTQEPPALDAVRELQTYLRRVK